MIQSLRFPAPVVMRYLVLGAPTSTRYTCTWPR